MHRHAKQTIHRPFLKWAGAKTRVVPALLPLLPAGQRFVEPFVGSGAVFLNTQYPVSLLADSNPDVIELYRTLARQGDAFVESCQRLFVQRNNEEAQFYRLRNEFNSCRDLEHRAALFVYLNRHCFNGLCRYNQKGQFNAPFGSYDAPHFPASAMMAFSRKLCTAELQAADFRDVMEKLGVGDVAYCDPPYVPISATASFTTYAAGGFTASDQRDLAELCVEATRRGAVVVVSNHDTAFTRAIYKDAAQMTTLLVSRTISCDGQNRHKAKELIAVFRPQTTPSWKRATRLQPKVACARNG